MTIQKTPMYVVDLIFLNEDTDNGWIFSITPLDDFTEEQDEWPYLVPFRDTKVFEEWWKTRFYFLGRRGFKHYQIARFQVCENVAFELKVRWG